MTRLQAALALARQGFAVVPFHGVTRKDGASRCTCRHSDCERPGKHPWSRSGYKDATKDELEVQRLWKGSRREKIANVAIACGPISGVDALDVDGPVGEASLAALEKAHGALPWTMQSRSGRVGGGRHLYFKHDARAYNVVAVADGLDVRTKGNGVIAPPSLHASGNAYEWLLSPDDADPAPWPEWLIALIDASRKHVPAPRNPNLARAPEELTPYGRKVVQSCFEDMDSATVGSEGKPGNRNAVLNRAAFVLGQCSSAGEPTDASLRVLEVIALGKGLSQREVDEVAQRSFKKGQQNPREIRILLEEHLGRDALFSVTPPRPPAATHTGTNGTTPPITGTNGTNGVHPPTPNTSATKPPRPLIRVIGHEIPRMVDEADVALAAANLCIYQRHRELVRVARSEKVQIETLHDAQLLEALSRCANWVKYEPRSEKDRPTKPPVDVVRVMATRGDWKVNHLKHVTDGPILRLDGTVLQDPGYDALTRTFYHPTRDFPRVLDSPTIDDARLAIAELKEPFSDFPFTTASDFSTALAMILTIVGRQSIAGPTPFWVVRATDAGVGKGLLVHVASTIATGSTAGVTTFTEDVDEQEKRLTAFGTAGKQLVLLDNVDKPLGGAVLAAATTAPTYETRVLGRNDKMITFQVPVLVATGINVVVTNDLGRRVLPVDMDPKCEQPDKRTGFKHADLQAYANSERPRLAVAALTVLRAWFVAGQPKSNLSTFGSFEAWSSIIRQTLVWTGEADPAEGRERIREDSDLERDAVLGLLEVWHRAFPLSGNSIPEAIDFAKRGDAELVEAFLHLDSRMRADALDGRKIGWHFRRMVGRVVGGYRLERAGRSKSGFKWRVVKVDESVVQEDLPPCTDPADLAHGNEE